MNTNLEAVIVAIARALSVARKVVVTWEIALVQFAESGGAAIAQIADAHFVKHDVAVIVQTADAQFVAYLVKLRKKLRKISS